MGPKKANRTKEDDLTGRKRREVIHCPTLEGGGGDGREEGKGCQLELLDVIHSDGILSTMYSCRDTVTQKKYMVKRVYLQRMRQSDREYRLRETAIWTGLRHRYILTCFTGWQSGAELWLLSEAASETLEQVVRKKGLPPPQPLFEHWLYQLASALQYLHEFQEKTILHRNLKPSNIMVAPHYVLKLTDFGVSKELQDSRDMTRSCVGTAAIMSPEMVNNDPYSTKTDMWSLGITAVFIATQQEAICAGTFDTLFRKTREGQVRSINGQYSAGIEDLVHSLLQVDPCQRPSASQFLTHLRLCSSHCDTPATAHSYPERHTVPQKGAGSPAEPPRQSLSSGSGSRSGSRSNDAQRKAERRGHKTTVSTEGAGGGDVRLSMPATDNDAPSPPGAESLSLSLVYMMLSRQHSAGGKTSSDRRNVAQPATPLDEKKTVPFNERRGKHIDREQIASAINSNVQALTPSRLRGERHRRKSHEGLTPQADPHYQNDPSFSRRRSEGDQHKAAKQKSSARKAQDEESGSTASGGARARFPIRRDTFGTVNLDEREEVFGQDYRGADSPTSDALTSDTITLSTLTLDASTSDTWTSDPKLINTFPGAFNVSPPADPHLSHQQGDRAERRSPVRCWSESDALEDGRGQRRGTRNSGETASGRSRPDLLEGPVDSWPENMREYWILANDLVERLGADTFSTALKYASLFSEMEVQEWLKERGVGSAGQIMEDLKELIGLDDQLDVNTRRTFNSTLLERSHVGEVPASKPC